MKKRRKPRPWRNSYARTDMEDGVLKKCLDSLEDNTSDLSSALYKLSKAAEVFGYADAYTAMEELISKGNRTPSYDDIAATCRRIGQWNSIVPIGSGTVNLSKFD